MREQDNILVSQLLNTDDLELLENDLVEFGYGSIEENE